MATKTVCVSVNISRENNGKVKIQPIKGITKMRISSVIFKHGRKKAAPKRPKPNKKSRKYESDSDSEDCRYENGNDDMMEALYMELLVNDFARGQSYYYDSSTDDDSKYTCRIPLDLDCDGTGDHTRVIEFDWELVPGDKPKDIDHLDVTVKTDKLLNPKCYDMIIEFLFVVNI